MSVASIIVPYDKYKGIYGQSRIDYRPYIRQKFCQSEALPGANASADAISVLQYV